MGSNAGNWYMKLRQVVEQQTSAKNNSTSHKRIKKVGNKSL
jgi:hypothetical protein